VATRDHKTPPTRVHLSGHTLQAIEHYRSMLMAERRAARQYKKVINCMAQVPHEDMDEFYRVTQEMIETYDPDKE